MFEFAGKEFRTNEDVPLSYAFMKLARAAQRIEKGTPDQRNAAVMELLTLQLDTLERVIHADDFPALEAELQNADFPEIESAINALVAGQAGRPKDASESSTASPVVTSVSRTSSSSSGVKARAKKN